MKTIPCLLVAGWLAFAPAVTHAKIERLVEKTFTVQPGGTLKIGTQGGNISVRAGADNQVHLVAREKIRADSEAEADKLLQDLTLTMEQTGNDVEAVAKYQKENSGWHFGSWPPVQVVFEVTVPAKYSAILRTSGGDVQVGDLTGRVEVRTSGGDVTVGRIDGDVKVGTSGGDIQLAQATGAADLGTSGGEVTVGSVGGSAKISSSGGDLHLGPVAGALQAHTSGGDVTAELKGPLKGDCSLGSSGGKVKVTVDRGVGFELEAATSGGEVKAPGLSITLEQGRGSKSRLAGAVNGGGPKLRLRSSGGDIVIVTR
ncbi:MAG: DUF4097 family beta strand repeat-containing protein [Opitutales bacterium]